MTRMHRKMNAILTKTFLTIVYVILLLSAGVGADLASSLNELTEDAIYKSYEDGFKAGKKILKKEYRDTSLLDGCIRISDHTLWKNQGYDENTAKKAEKIFFFGCTNVRGKKMNKREFLEKYVW